MNRTNYHLTRRQQSGAALVVGLILLVALTLLALSSMNTASLDLIMAGNEQYRARTFNAAEAGIEAAHISDSYFTTEAPSTSAPQITGTTSTGESYKVWIKPYNNGAVYSATDGNSVGTYRSIFFTIESNATGTRDATAKHYQEEKWTVKVSDTSVTTDSSLDTDLETTSVTGS